MPFALAPLGVSGLALIAFLTALIVTAILVMVIGKLPNVGIPFTSINLRNILNDAAGALEHQILDRFKSGFVHVGNWLYAHGWTLLAFLSPLVSVIGHLVDQVNHHTSTAIPGAVTDAVSKANTYADAAAARAKDQAVAAASADLTEAKNYADAVGQLMQQAAHSELATTEAALARRISSDEAVISQLITAAVVTIPKEITDAVNAARAADQAALANTASNLQTQITGLQSQIDRLSSAVSADESTIATALQSIDTLSKAESVDAQAIATQRGIIAQAQNDIADNVTAIDQLRSQLDTARTGIDNITAAQTLTTAQDNVIGIAAGSTIAVAVGALATQVAAITSEIASCMVTTCDGPNSLRNVLPKMLRDLVAVGEFGFLAEAIKDPIATAQALAPALEAIDAGANDTLDAILELV